MQILYADDALAVCVKPVGAASEGDGPEDVPALLSAQLGGPVYPVHRLDKAVGGVMVWARTSACAAYLSGCVQAGTLRKEYLAVLPGQPEAPEGELCDLLFHDRQKNRTYVVKRPRAGVKSAKLAYRLAASQDGLSLVQVRLYTGRTHQIRVQFASRGLPLLGDGKYGSREKRCTPALWSYRLTFPHPTLGARSFTVLPPQTWPWTQFGEAPSECSEVM